MNEDTISEWIRTSREQRSAVPQELDEHEEEYPSYGRLRGLRSMALMLELRLADGNYDAYDYGWLNRAYFNPSEGILLHFNTVRVMIRGKNLRPIYEGVLQHRIPWIAVIATPEHFTRDPDATLVVSIDVELSGTLILP